MMLPLAVLGNVNVDLIMGPVAPWPVPGTEVLLDHDDLRAGGSAGNTALAWAALGLPFAVPASVGDDLFGRWLCDQLAPHSAHWVTVPEATTLSVGLTHPDGERTFFTMGGHLPSMDWEVLRPQIEHMTGGLLLLCGSFLTHRLTAAYPAIFAWAEARDIAIALDPGWPPAGWSGPERARMTGWLAHVRHLLINEAEALALTGATDVDAALTMLERMLPQGATAVIKAGPKGALARRGSATARAPAPAVRVVDTIGAGDIFNAGYLAAVARGADLTAALSAGTALASRAISTFPRQYGLPDSITGAA